MPVISAAEAVDSETHHAPGSPERPPSALKILLIAGVLVLIVLLMLGLPRQAADGWLPAPFNVSREEVAIYFSKVNGTESITEAVKRKVPPRQQGKPLQYALQALLAGPTAEEKKQGYFTEIPEGTRLRGVAMRQDGLQIDFSTPFGTGGGSTTMIQRLKQVKDTVYAVDSHYQVHVMVDGTELQTLGGEGLEVSPSMEREAP